MIQQSSRRRRRSCSWTISLCCTSAVLLVLLCASVLLLLPGHVDKLLLTDTNYCCLDEQPASDRRVNVDGLKYNDGRNKHHEKVGQHENYLLQRIIDSLTWNVVVLHHKTGRDDDACPVTKEVGTNRLESVFGCQQLHPVCKNDRTLRTHLRA